MTMASNVKKNRLAAEKSPYLLQHCANPVDWYPWGTEAFDKARKEDKLIFLSVGYSTCHWCHVMEHESFENENVAKVMNEHFVNIKVDREERPDVDKVYMTFVQATSGGGGWPMSVWLTPDLKPVFGGTYFPPSGSFGRPGFTDILLHISKEWKTNKSQLVNTGTNVVSLLEKHNVMKASSKKVPECKVVTQKCISQMSKSYEPKFGGFGSAPKFPQPVNLNFLFNHYAATASDDDDKEKTLRMCTHTLLMMANGGIHDHIGHGFHRYSTDSKWHVPHFEKMLYDQGQLAVAYLTAFMITNDQRHADIVKDILLYVDRDLSHSSGAFFSAEDADSLPTDKDTKKKEGAFCVWTRAEVEKLLGKKHLEKPNENVTYAQIFSAYYDVKEKGNVDPAQDPHDELREQNVLIVRQEPAVIAEKFQITVEVMNEALAESRRILFDFRQKRPGPHLDDKILTAWNGLIISGFAQAGPVLDNKYTERAIKALKCIRANLYDEKTGMLYRSCYPNVDGSLTRGINPINGFLEDYSYLIRALLDTYESTGDDDQWLQWAVELQAKQDELFWDETNHAYFSNDAKDPSVILRIKDDQDGAEPSPNSVSASNLMRLADILHDDSYREKAKLVFLAFGERLTAAPIAVPEMVGALIRYELGSKQVVITGESKGQDTKGMLKLVRGHFLPTRILIYVDTTKKTSFLREKVEFLKNLPANDGKATAYVCQNFECKKPVHTTDELKTLILS